MSAQMSVEPSLSPKVIEGLVQLKASRIEDFLRQIVQIGSPPIFENARQISPGIEEAPYAEPEIGLEQQAPIRLIIKVNDPIHVRLHVDFRGEPTDCELISSLIKMKLRDLLLRQELVHRRAFSRIANRSRDINSSSYRICHYVKDNIITAKEISIFLLNTRTRTLNLSATTIDIKNHTKDDFAIRLEDPSPAQRCFREAVPATYDISRLSNMHSQRFVDVAGLKHNRMYVPIRTISDDIGSPYPIIGVLRLGDVCSAITPGTHSLTEYDEACASLAANLAGDILTRFIALQDQYVMQERFAHGVGGNLDVAAKYISIISDAITVHDAKFGSNSDNYNGILFELLRGDNIVRDLASIIDDIRFQFDKAKGLGPHRGDPEGRISSLFTEVLMPAVRLAPGIASINSRPQPRFNMLKEAGLLDVPKLRGDPATMLLVLRNLIENSIKYTADRAAEINITAWQTDNHVVIEYRDNGIGIDESDARSLFIEGFRGRKASRVSNRGSGLGLAFCKEALQSIGGDIRSKPSDNGAFFEIVVSKMLP